MRPLQHCILFASSLAFFILLISPAHAGFIEDMIKKQMLGQIAKQLGQNAPTVSSYDAVFPTVPDLPDQSFQPRGHAKSLLSQLATTPDGSVKLSPGDYEFKVRCNCMKHSGHSPSGHLYNHLTQTLLSDAALDVLAKHIRESESFKQGKKVIAFPFHLSDTNPVITNEQAHLQHIQHSDVHLNLSTGIILDPVEAVCGNFSFYAIPYGEATVEGDKIVIKVSKFAIYEVNSYHFSNNSPPYLGYWKKTDGLAADISGAFGGGPPNGYTKLANKDYRAYRTRHNYGRDCLVVSDTKMYKLPAPVIKERPKKQPNVPYNPVLLSP